MGWSFLRPEMNEFLDLLPAQQRLDEATWYRGTADAVYQNFDIFRAARPEYFIVLAGDHIYKMDYSNMLQDHVDKGADCTVACVEVPLDEASDFGVMAVDESMSIVDFLEKPKIPPAMAGKPGRALASMGVYVFSAEFLYAELERDHRDRNLEPRFRQGRDPAPREPRPRRRPLVRGELRQDHARGRGLLARRRHDRRLLVGQYRSGHAGAARSTSTIRNWPIWTYQQQLPPAKFVFDDDDRRGMAVDSMVSGGCIISGATVGRSLLFSNCRINSHARTCGAVLLPDVEVGRRARLNKVVVDRGCHIPEDLVIGEDPELDARRFYRSDRASSSSTPTCWLPWLDNPTLILLGGEHAVPVGRRGLDLELGDAPSVEIVDGCEETSRGEPAVVEQAQRRRPILPTVGAQQRGMLADELLLGNLLRRQRVDVAGFALALDRYEIDFDQRRIAEALSRLFADHQIDAVDLAEAFQPRGEVHRIAEQRVVEMLLRAEIADDAFPGVDPKADAHREEDLVGRLRPARGG